MKHRTESCEDRDCQECGKLAALGERVLGILTHHGATETVRAASQYDEEQAYLSIYRTARSFGLLGEEAQR